jgi:hypothetical protein
VNTDCRREANTTLVSGKAFALAAFAVLSASCSVDLGRGENESANSLQPPNACSHSADTSRSVVQRGPRIDFAYPESSRPFATLPQSNAESRRDHEPLRPIRPRGNKASVQADSVVQSGVPIMSMPGALQNFPGQGNANGGPCSTGSCLTPPDPNGAVGPNHFVQATNANGTAGIAIWSKSGTLLSGPKPVQTLWTGYVGTNPGNGCAANDDGDAVIVYDQLADRWFITQFSLPNETTNSGPAFQCVAVSKTSDPTGAYWLYDFKYGYSVDDYGKFGVWPDAYYVEINQFNASGYAGADFCAYDRNNMLQGATATQQCFFQAWPSSLPKCPAVQPFEVFGALPISLDGKIPPPNGEPGYFLQFDYSQCDPPYNQLDLWSLHVDFTTPANSTLTGPTVLTVANFTPTCHSASPTYGNCVPQPGTTVTLDGLDDRVMFRFAYRNFGSYESLLVNHSVIAGAGSGIRWYEIRSPQTAPTVFQQGTYAPGDTNWRWMASMAQDQAADFALGFAVSSTGAPGVVDPSIGWTGRINTDAAGTMGQGESVIDPGGGVEGDAYPGSPDEHRGRWGDYSNMTVDPNDDCTFWYTQGLYRANSIAGWDTYIATVKFPNCAANDFSLTVTPATQSVAPSGTVNYTVTTASVAGTAETIALNVQNLPAGVTATFNPVSVTAGATSTLQLAAASSAPLTGTPAPTFTVIGNATSAVHATTAQIAVVACGVAGEACCPPNKTCASGNYCTASGQCASLQGNGTTCSSGNQCQSANCVSNVCCNSACGACGTCSTGTCSSLPGGSGGSPSCKPYVCTGSSIACPTSCTSDANCISGDYCNASGQCVPQQANGAACSGTDQCQSALCVSGVCCNSACGACGTCATGTCVALSSGSSGSPACAPYLCSGTGVICPSSCTADGNCVSGDYCNASGQCVPQQANGATCSGTDQCQSGNCVSGVCCNAACGPCGSCSTGTCTNLSAGNSGTPSCTPYLCSGTGVTCPTSCTTDSDCISGDYCNASGACVAQQANGATCTGADQCQSANCAAGICCNSACGPCGSCSTGTCTNLTAGNAGSPSCAPYVCDGSGVACPSFCTSNANCSTGDYCNASGACVAQQANGTICTGPGQCHSGNCVSGICCDTGCGACGSCSTGTCTDLPAGNPGNPACSPYLCAASSSTCPTSCTSSSDCVSGLVCEGDACVPIPPDGGSTSGADSGGPASEGDGGSVTQKTGCGCQTSGIDPFSFGAFAAIAGAYRRKRRARIVA